MDKIGKISLVTSCGQHRLDLVLDYNGSGMPAFYVADKEEEMHWQLNPDSVTAILNMLNDSMLIMLRTMASELYSRSPDDPVQIIRPTDHENVVPFRRS